ncbi:hypothetical protein IX318_000059 [Porphyromonas levii]|nr:hypothetical protein [Porphyromonas levii]MBR8714224.1 hypothetical protein [Porphyromonas levii]MBR8726766.1 hypothetical protein [Porphyromonas levii]MBR8735071.1 hypothetical protein [Porphyromonas levii]MBR8777174.1 hypothetical protein [Porphyromonas levii]
MTLPPPFFEYGNIDLRGMKKIMFNDRFCLTQAVLDGRKRQERRIIKPQPEYKEDKGLLWKGAYSDIGYFRLGEVVEIAQSYYNAKVLGDNTVDYPLIFDDGDTGYRNKMFVKSALMPHQIKITNVRVERLQDISDEDCIAEGVRMVESSNNWGNSATHTEYNFSYYDKRGNQQLIRGLKPQETYSYLIDKINGQGTWERNPWVWVYDFELVR